MEISRRNAQRLLAVGDGVTLSEIHRHNGPCPLWSAWRNQPGGVHNQLLRLTSPHLLIP